MTELISPFDHELIITLTEGEEEETRDSFLDIYVVLTVNGTVKLRFKSEMGEDEDGNTWKGWEAGDEDDQILCRLDKEDTTGWRGLVVMEVQKVLENEAFDDGEEKKPWVKTELFTVKKSAITT